MGDPVELTAWRDMCRRLEALGERLVTPGFPAGAADRAEGFAHLAQQVVCWLGWTVGHGDPRRPAFQRQNDLVTPWGGPNNDNTYRHAPVRSGLRYRLRGRMHGCDDFILAVRAGFMGQERWGTLLEVTGSELGIGRGDELDLLLGGHGPEPNRIPLPEGAATVSIREYYLDWQAEEPAVWTIECLDEEEPAPRPTGEDVAARLAEATSFVEHSLVYWNDYMADARAGARDNTFAASQRVAKGLALARYAFCFWSLGPDEALVVETDVPDARYWSLHLYTLGWFEPVDPRGRITSLNHRQAVVDGDRVRAVVAATDPGVANWLDTAGRPDGLLTLRWFWPRSDGAPAPSARVVPLAELDGDVDPAARADTLRSRRRHLDWRFRA